MGCRDWTLGERVSNHEAKKNGRGARTQQPTPRSQRGYTQLNSELEFSHVTIVQVRSTSRRLERLGAALQFERRLKETLSICLRSLRLRLPRQVRGCDHAKEL